MFALYLCGYIASCYGASKIVLGAYRLFVTADRVQKKAGFNI